ncbi:MAG: helix-turn-helix transcriptional regulator [Deltaproteobacteria bacterium]|jgi:putative molybdopterin biosynthesis protein|nr:helix-turn-helix transcriptional regulator [Deltaproteobacteria bacterium]
MEEQTTLTAQDVAKVLRVAKNTVYELVKRGELNHYKVGRKMRFARSDVERYINESRQVQTHDTRLEKAQKTTTKSESGFIISGQDALLDVLTGFLGRRGTLETQALRSYVGSYKGLVSLYHGDVQAATAHLWDGDSGKYNIPFVRRLLPGIPAMVIHLTGRVQGFYVASGNPKGIKAWSDLRRPDLAIVNREKGAGSRVLLDEHLRLLGLRGRNIVGYEREELSHLSVAGAVGRGEADLGVGDLKAASQVDGVDFLALQNEQYDLVIKKDDLESAMVLSILDILRSKEFQSQFQFMKGYDIKGMGNIIAET